MRRFVEPPQPRERMRFCDPTFGTAAIPIVAAKYVKVANHLFHLNLIYGVASYGGRGPLLRNP
jgi:hypothetical protein